MKKILTGLLLMAAVAAGIFLLSRRGAPTEKTPEDQVPEVTASVEKEKAPEEEFYYVEELAAEGAELQKYVFVEYLGQLCQANLYGDKGDGHQCLIVETVKDGKELFSYESEGILRNFAAVGEELCFLETLPDGGLRFVSLDKTGRVIEQSPLEGHEWQKADFTWINYPSMYGADEKYVYLNRHDYSTNKLFFEIYHRDGTLFRSVEHRRGAIYFVDRKGHYYTMNNETLKQFDVESEKENYRKDVPHAWTYWTDTAGEHLYLVSDSGDILSYRLSDGALDETLLSFGTDTSYMLNEGYQLLSAGRDGEALYLQVEARSEDDREVREEDRELYYFRYEKVIGKRPERKNTLRVEVPYETEALRAAKRRFEMHYKDTSVEFLSKYNDENSYYSNREQYQEQMKVKLAANDVGDLVEVDRALDRHTIAKSDIFVNLKPYLERSKIREELNSKLLSAYEKNGVLRGIPTEYAVDYYQFHRKAAEKIGWTKDPEEWKWSDILSLAKKLEKEGSSAYLFSEPGDFPYRLINIVRANMPDTVDYEKKTVDLHQDWFMDLLKQLKEVNRSSNIGYDVRSNPVQHPATEFDFMGDGMLYQEWWRDFMFGNLGITIDVAAKKDLGLVKTIRGEQNANRAAEVNQVFAITEKSTQKERAWQFLEVLLSKEVQLNCNMLPVNRKATDRRWQLMKNQNRKLELVEEFEKMHRAIVEDFDFILPNDYVNTTVVKHLKEYLDDKLTLEEALTKAENDVRIILNE